MIISLLALSCAFAVFFFAVLAYKKHDPRSFSYKQQWVLLFSLTFILLTWYITRREHWSPSAMNVSSSSLPPYGSPLKYKWGHAINSQALLDATLLDRSINAIEADIIYSEKQHVPVMGHPPATDGDLTLKDFLQELTAHSYQKHRNTLVKLDFKSEKAFEAAMDDVTSYIEETAYPEGLFLNADILLGPCKDSSVCGPKFNSSLFLERCSRIPQAVLSVGWTTDTNEKMPYTNDMVQDMLSLLDKHTTKDTVVTFPVRATSFRQSWDTLRRLYSIPNFGITLWWSKYALEDVEFEWIFNTLEKDDEFRGRTFYDIKGFDKFYTNLSDRK